MQECPQDDVCGVSDRTPDVFCTGNRLFLKEWSDSVPEHNLEYLTVDGIKAVAVSNLDSKELEKEISKDAGETSFYLEKDILILTPQFHFLHQSVLNLCQNF